MNNYMKVIINALKLWVNENLADLDAKISNKVDTIDGKGLSTNDFTDAYKTKLDGLENITFEETDPTVPSWAKQPNKPTYTAAEVGALPADTFIPSVVDLESYIDNKITYKQDTITGTAGQFVIIGADGKPTTRTIPYAEEATF